MSGLYCKKQQILASLIIGYLCTIYPSWASQSLPISSQGSVSSPTSVVIPTPAAADLMSTLHENPDIEAQVKGQYPGLERKESLPLGAIQHAWDKAGPTAGVYQVIYNPAEIIRVRCREMMATTLVFPSWERIEKVVMGDAASFKTETPKANIILIQPQEFIGLDSNMTAIGASGKVYSFYLRSEGFNTHQVSDLTVYIRVTKPQHMPTSLLNGTSRSHTSAHDKNDYLEEATFDPANLNFAFDMAGDPEIAPERVYSDGIRTWFDYGPDIAKRNLPAVYAVVDGIDTPLNVNRDGSKIVAQGAGAFTLKAGQKLVCITPTAVSGH